MLAFAVGNAIIAVALLFIRVATLDDQDVAADERIGNAQRQRIN